MSSGIPVPPSASEGGFPTRDVLSRLESLLVAGAAGATDAWFAEAAQAAATWPVAELRSHIAYLTWISRRHGHPIPTRNDPSERGTRAELMRLYMCGQRFRFDFNFAGLDAYLDEHMDSPHGADALVQSFRVFTKLGRGAQDAVITMNNVLSLPDVDARVRHVCLAGLWAAHTVPDQASLLLRQADIMIELNGADGTAYFRRATAHRLLGMRNEALDDIDMALSLLAPGNNDINQDYLRERQLIGLMAQ